jgi:hypothetical protein
MCVAHAQWLSRRQANARGAAGARALPSACAWRERYASGCRVAACTRRKCAALNNGSPARNPSRPPCPRHGHTGGQPKLRYVQRRGDGTTELSPASVEERRSCWEDASVGKGQPRCVDSISERALTCNNAHAGMVAYTLSGAISLGSLACASSCFHLVLSHAGAHSELACCFFFASALRAALQTALWLGQSSVWCALQQ